MRKFLVGHQLSGLVRDFIKFKFMVNDLESELAVCSFHSKMITDLEVRDKQDDTRLSPSPCLLCHNLIITS